MRRAFSSTHPLRSDVRSMKVQFEIVALEVEKMYSKEIHESNLIAIQEQTELIQEFIESCGYDVDTFFLRWFRRIMLI